MKKYFEGFSLRVKRLGRISCGSVRLGELGKGMWRDLNPGELRSLRKMTGILPGGSGEKPPGDG